MVSSSLAKSALRAGLPVMPVRGGAAVRLAPWVLVAVLAGVASLPGPARAEAPANAEARIKAAFVFNFAKFIEWPATAFPAASAPFVIGILGDDGFGGAMDDVIAGETIGGHPLTTRRVATAEACRDCHLVIVSPAEAGRLEAILAAYRGRPILTVSDLDRFAQRGGGIGLFKEESRVRFQINSETTTAAGLTVSSKLMALGQVVGASANP